MIQRYGPLYRPYEGPVWSREAIPKMDQIRDHIEGYIRTLTHVPRLVLCDYYSYRIGYTFLVLYLSALIQEPKYIYLSSPLSSLFVTYQDIAVMTQGQQGQNTWTPREISDH